MGTKIIKDIWILDTPEQIHAYRLHVLLIGLETEIKFSGHQLTRGRSCYSRIKSEFNLKGNKQKVYDQFKNLMIEMGVPFKK